MIMTPNRKWHPVAAHPVKRMGSAPLDKGKYLDANGDMYDESSVPNGIQVWRSHWGDCPGAKEARRKNG
jgi:hypothetical protein